MTAMQFTHMLPADLQETNEYRFAKKHIDKYLDTCIRETPDSEAKVHQGVELLSQWLAYWTGPYTDQCKSEKHYNNKKARLSQLNELELEGLVREIFVGIAYFQVPTLYVSVTAQLALRIGLDDHRDAIVTMAELVAVLAATAAFDLTKEDEQSSVMVTSLLYLPTELKDAIARSIYLPPLVCEPQEVASNFESPYLTFNDSLMLGKGNSHLGDLCLDVINTQNKVALKLDTQFLSTVEEEPTFELDTLEKLQGWENFKYASYGVYNLLVKQGNKFWLHNKVDKRGRLYAQGYHVTTQGSAFKKAMIELHHEEIVNGV